MRPIASLVIALLIVLGWTAPPAWAAEKITKLADSGDTGEAASQVAVVGVGRRAVTAIRNPSTGALKLIVWNVTFEGQLVREGDSGTAAGTGNKISVVAFAGFSVLVTAARGSGGKLKLVQWKLNGGTISKTGDSGDQAGEVLETSIAALPNGRLVTAVRTASGKLKLIAWHATGSGNIMRLGDSGDQAGPVGRVSVASTLSPALSANPPHRVVTAVQTASGILKLIVWEITEAGSVVRNGDYTFKGLVTNYLATVNVLDNRVASIVRAPLPFGKNIVDFRWDVTADGQPQANLPGSGVGVGGELAATRLGFGLPGIAFVTLEGNLRAFVGGADTGNAGAPATKVAITGVDKAAMVFEDPKHRFVTAVRGTNGNLRVTAWEWE